MRQSFRKNKTVWFMALCMFAPVSLLVFVAGSKFWEAHAAAVERANTPKLCKKLTHAGGFAKSSRSMAEMSAVVSWARKVSAHGQDYNFWTNASFKSIRCRKIRGTVMYNCTAIGKPCKILHGKAPAMQMAGLK
ncbi:MAG: hypothetical protein ACRBBN_04030 [Methyloligellaceae bacterium]